MPLPLYNSANFNLLSGSPPFVFPGVSLRMFPLKADIYALRTFCSQLVNVAPPEVAEFEPFTPFVFLTVLHYGQMSTLAANLGWVSQHEITFSVPLMQFRRRGGRRRFVRWVSLTPFIFVDNELSLLGGREVYGWPKQLATLTGGVEQWMDDPTGPQTLMSLSAQVLSVTGAHASTKPLIEIEDLQLRDAPFGSLSLRPWTRAATALPRAALGALSVGADLMEILAAPPFLGYAPGDRALLAQGLLQGFVRGFPRLQQSPSWDILTFKQVRDAVLPEAACYQALVLSHMEMGRFNAGGMMGGASVLQGDPSGGFRIKIFDYASQPIVGSLGLEVEEHVSAGDTAFDVLRPVYPYWIEMDLLYGRGRNICWRAETPSWHARGLPPKSTLPAARIRFDAAEGLANPQFPGPFELQDGMIHVLALAARPHRLRSFVDAYLTLPQELGRFEPHGNVVCLAVGTYGLVSSLSQPIGSLSARTAAFLIPVRWHRPHGDCRIVLVPAYVFVDSPMMSITSVEVTGLPALQAGLGGPPDYWLRSPTQVQPLLGIQLLLLPVMNLGVEAEQRLLVGIGSGHLPSGERKSPNYGPREAEWTEQAKQEAQRRLQAAMQSPCPLTEPVSFVTLKQIRDAYYPERACFQQYLLGMNRLEISRLEPLEQPIHVWIYRYPVIPIVERLGLIAREEGTGVSWGASQGAGFDILRSVCSASFQGSLQGLENRSLCWRAGSERWKRSKPDPPSYIDEPGKSSIPSGKGSSIPRPGKAGGRRS